MDRLSAAGQTAHLDALLQRDPRMKLLLLLLLIVGVFSTSRFYGLLLLGSPALLFFCWRPEIFKVLVRRLWFLRWLLLFTLVLHLLLTPGQTLFGMRLLSYDGLLRGILVDLQLVLALFFTLLYSLSTATDRIAYACMQLLKPIGKVGVNVSAVADQLALVLHFLPEVFAEGSSLTKGHKGVPETGLSGRIELLAGRVRDVVFRLVDLADRTACQIAEGASPVHIEDSGQRWVWVDSLWLTGGVLLVLASWSL